MPTIVTKMSLFVSSGWRLAGIFLVVSLLTTIFPSMFILPGAWTRLWGPLVFQTWKFLLYFSWFLLGVALGANKENMSLSHENLKPWPIWLAIGIFVYVVAVVGLRPEHFANTPQWVVGALSATIYSLCCTFNGLAMVGAAHAFFRTAR